MIQATGIVVLIRMSSRFLLGCRVLVTAERRPVLFPLRVLYSHRHPTTTVGHKKAAFLTVADTALGGVTSTESIIGNALLAVYILLD